MRPVGIAARDRWIVAFFLARSRAHRLDRRGLIDRNGCRARSPRFLPPLSSTPLAARTSARGRVKTEETTREAGRRGRGRREGAGMIRSELNRRPEFQRISRPPGCRANANGSDRGGGKDDGGRRAVETDVMHRRRYVFRMQSSEWNAQGA